MPHNSRDLFTYIAGGMAAILLLIIVWAVAAGYNPKFKIDTQLTVQSGPTKEELIIDPTLTHCIGDKYWGTPQQGWRRMYSADKDYVEALVRKGKAEIYPPQTMVCSYSGANGVVKFPMREPWWRFKRKELPVPPQACGDYTPVPAPKIKVVSV